MISIQLSDFFPEIYLSSGILALAIQVIELIVPIELEM